MSSDLGFTPRARRDIERAVECGRFTVTDIDLAMALVFGTAMALGHLIHEQPDRDDQTLADDATESLLRMLGMSDNDARDLAHGDLPKVPDFANLATEQHAS